MGAGRWERAPRGLDEAGRWGRARRRRRACAHGRFTSPMQQGDTPCETAVPRLKGPSAGTALRPAESECWEAGGKEDRTGIAGPIKASRCSQARLSHRFHQGCETGIVAVLLTHAVPVTRTRFWLPRKVRLRFMLLSQKSVSTGIEETNAKFI